MRFLFKAALAFLALLPQSWAQPGWQPSKAVEIIVPTAPGGGNDVVARLIQKTLQDGKLVPTPVVVLNRAGGNQTLSVAYHSQQGGDPHYLLFATSTLLTNQIQGLGRYQYTDFPALGLAFIDYQAFMVPANSPFKTLHNLLAQLKSDPDSIAFSVIARGGSSHAALALVAKAADIDPRRLKIVVYKTSAEATTAMMGGHIQAAVSSASGSTPHVVAGNIRMLAIAVPQRRTGALAAVPTLSELGINAPALDTWRGIFGARGITPAQVAYWQEALGRAFAADEYRSYVTKHDVAAPPLKGPALTQYFEDQYKHTRAVLLELGMAK
jgi:putative tricarboxylic transport membrane protein